jgi:NAD(P)-dependent dehydrogenase (short-subunit alcohol dehydrogenase family)
MDLTGRTILITGSNRGIGRALVDAALAAGAGKAYAAARTPVAIDDPRVAPIALDVTDHAAIARLADELVDVDVVINNAGVANLQPAGAADLDVARRELEVNYLGLAAMVQAFAPVLAARGGGAVVNILSVAAWIGSPALSTYAASKSAAWAFTNQARVVLADQGTQVTAAFFGYVDTDLTAGLDVDKLSPAEVAAAIIAGVTAGEDEVIVDEQSRAVKAALPDDQRLLYPMVAEQYRAARAAAHA